MKIKTIRILNGANIFSHQPVLVMCLDLEELKNKESREIVDFNRRLLESLPELKEHHCTHCRAGDRKCF